MSLQIISTNEAPAAIGPYSQAIVANGFIYTSGQIPIDPKTSELVPNDIKLQTKQAMQNLFSVLEAAGSSRNKVVKVVVFLKDMEHFKNMNMVFEEMFQGHKPARSTVEVARLPRDVLIEIEAVAVV